VLFLGPFLPSGKELHLSVLQLIQRYSFFSNLFFYTPFLVKLLYQLNFYFISSYLNIEYLKILSKLFKITSNIISVVIISVVIISVVIISVVIISVVIISVVIISVVIISVDFYIRCYLNIFTNIKNIYIFLLGFNQTPNFIEVHYIPIFISSYIFFIGVQPDTQFY